MYEDVKKLCTEGTYLYYKFCNYKFNNLKFNALLIMYLFEVELKSVNVS